MLELFDEALNMVINNGCFHINGTTSIPAIEYANQLGARENLYCDIVNGLFSYRNPNDFSRVLLWNHHITIPTKISVGIVEKFEQYLNKNNWCYN